MSPEIGEFIPLVLSAPLLAAMAIGDLRRLRISNRLVLAMLAIFVLSAPFLLPPSEIGARVIVALSVFVLGTAGFALGLWGGGDVKALAALMLFLPSAALPIYAYIFAFSMLAGIALVLTFRAAFGTPETAWHAFRPQTEFPMGLSIALSGMLLPLVLLVPAL
ncbi:prepilin peptidase [Sedimentitalea sp. JM2-8]|uniref:Prepilin peptidase n=1 Tax=Sedimentitalea xiamensis TaxID=3050037 RepID=A0ABT7FCA2_9RHOB|nr:prepilin peptidase [Sedimentitalea xiamensis]MDK3072575.1 prepilin peptidase [Sedimentitalea xiamensis]